MKHVNLIVCLLFVAGFCSCTTDRLLLETYRKSDCYNEFAPKVLVDGSYSNKDSNANGYQRFSSALFACQGRGRHCINAALVNQINLKYDGGSNLTATLYFWDGHNEQRLIKVKNNGSYLTLERSLFLIPIPVLYFVEESHKTILLTDASGQLIAVNRTQDFGMALLFLGGAHDERQAAIAPKADTPQ